MRWLAANGVRALVAAIAILAITAVAAIAYWKGGGSGTASTVLPNPLALSFTPGTPAAQLYPGGAASVTMVASNPNPYLVQISSIVAATGGGETFAVDAAHGGCDVSVLSFVPQDNQGAGWSVPPRVGTTDGTLGIQMPAAVKMGAASANACQGATFTVRLEGRSQ